MMNTNYFKCKICGKVSLLRRQMGYLSDYDINYKCLCGATIKGYSKDNRLYIDNAEYTDYDDVGKLPDQIVEISTEFICKKPYKPLESIDEHQSIFIRNVQKMDYNSFEKRFHSIIKCKKEIYLKIKNANELFEANNYELLKNLITDIFETIQNDCEFNISSAYPLNNYFEYIRALYFISIVIFLDENNLKDINEIRNTICHMYNDKYDEFNEYLKYINDNELLKSNRHNLFKIHDKFINYIIKLIPVISLDYYNGDKEEYFTGEYAITTITFEEIKLLYQDIFEWFTSSSLIIIGLDNLLLRGSFNLMRNSSNGKYNYSSLDGIKCVVNKGTVLNYLNDCGNELFENKFINYLNSDIRNAIGHFDYEDHTKLSINDNQEVIFKNIKNETDNIKISFIEFVYYVWKLNNLITLYIEVLYNLEKIESINNMDMLYMPIYNINSYYKTRVYPNDLCPCGSGKKYKKCCGKRN